MRDEYDFSDSQPNPYVHTEKRPVTIRLDVPVIEYFKAMAAETGMPYQSLINLYLNQCMAEGKRVAFA